MYIYVHVYMCGMCICVYGHVHMCVGTHACVFVCVRSETDIRCVPQSLHTLFFLRQYLIEPRDY